MFFSFCLQKPSIFDSVFIKAKQNPARYGWHLRCNQKSQWLILCVQFTDKWLVIARRRSNSIPWCTSFHVILSLRTWHIMITTLQHARNEHRSARCVWFPNMFRFSSFCFWEYWVSWYSLSFEEEFQRYFEGLHMFHWSVENYLMCARSQLQTQSMRLGNWT